VKGGREGGREGGRLTLNDRGSNLQIGAEVRVCDLTVFLCEFLHRLQGDGGVRPSSRGGAAGSWLDKEGGREGGRDGGRAGEIVCISLEDNPPRLGEERRRNHA
jgi:hypothetical protein